MMCFVPRHAIRYEAHGKSVVLLVCFECLKGEIRSDGKKIEFMTAATPEASWDSIFAKYGLSKIK